MSAEGKILAAQFTAAVLVIGGYIIYSGSREGVQPSIAGGTPGPNNGSPALAEGDSTGAVSPTAPVVNSAITNQDVIPVCEATPPGHLTNPSTCADYKLVPDPKGSRTCVQKGKYSIDNPRTLWGMKAVLGDPISQTDGDVTIYDSMGNPIGYFADGIPATFDGMDVQAEVDAFACLNN